jgi:hypothetical protein
MVGEMPKVWYLFAKKLKIIKRKTTIGLTKYSNNNNNKKKITFYNGRRYAQGMIPIYQNKREFNYIQ